MSIEVEVQIASTASDIPDASTLKSWLQHALAQRYTQGEVCLRIVDEEEIAELNQTYRQKAGPTNVLSFPCELMADEDYPLLGDIVISAPTVRQEAAAQHKDLNAHWAHLIIHGSLHLLGYDHIKDEEAAKMEALEIELLNTLHFPNPYK